jgi:hypothetical protein
LKEFQLCQGERTDGLKVKYDLSTFCAPFDLKNLDNDNVIKEKTAALNHELQQKYASAMVEASHL